MKKNILIVVLATLLLIIVVGEFGMGNKADDYKDLAETNQYKYEEVLDKYNEVLSEKEQSDQRIKELETFVKDYFDGKECEVEYENENGETVIHSIGKKGVFGIRDHGMQICY